MTATQRTQIGYFLLLVGAVVVGMMWFDARKIPDCTLPGGTVATGFAPRPACNEGPSR